MDPFPAIDPIPLPAPVWLFKLLHTVTLALHFSALHFLMGGLTLAIVWSFLGRLRRDEVMTNASGAVTARLPIVMAFVVNLGIPPLLFTQVLYGRALYTSSVLMGAWWMSVIFLIIIAYYGLYHLVKRVEKKGAMHWLALISFVIFLKVAFIYSKNMTLMLRPDLWTELYRTNAFGLQFHSGDPTTLPRWLFMMLGSVGMAGIGLMWLSFKGTLTEDVRGFLRRWGGRVLAVFTVVQIALAFLVYRAQPVEVREAVMAMSFYKVSGFAWLATAAALIALGALISVRPAGGLFTIVTSVVGLVSLVAMVLFRDGIRDASLKLAGFDVWAQATYSNWLTIIAFLILFVIGGALIFWMIAVMLRAKGTEEQYV